MSGANIRMHEGPMQSVPASEPRKHIHFHIAEVEHSVPAHFHETVLRFPERLAVTDEVNALSYAELDQRSNRVAWDLVRKLDLEGTAEIPVALVFGPGVDMIVALLGVLKTGCIAVPLNESLPADRLRYLLSDSQAQAIVTSGANVALAQRACATPIPVLDVLALDEEAPEINRGVAMSPETRACILYTSGSTGNPKGVIHDHRNLLHYTRWYTNSLKISAADRQSLLFSYGFIPGLTNILRALLNGASLHVFDPKNAAPGALARWLEVYRITLYHSVPMVFRQLCHGLTGQERFPDIRFIHLGGDSLRRGDVEAARTPAFPNAVFAYGLGTTETGPISRVRIHREQPLPETLFNMGHAADDKEILILSENGRCLETGQTGMIAVRSSYLAHGYWQRPNLTQGQFQNDGQSGKRLYRTGDLGQILPDGSLLFLGRMDHQVKVRGFRIELGEIESALSAYADVKNAVVVAQEVSPSERRLVAYVTSHDDTALSTAALRAHISAQLPDYMIPSIFIAIDELPLTPSGKVDRRSLPTPSEERLSIEQSFTPPRFPVEEQLASIWCDVLRLDRVGAEDDFFDLGGDSLLAAQVMSRISREFHLDIPVRVLFECPTIVGLAATLVNEMLQDDGI